jgi:hypothetical protein
MKKLQRIVLDYRCVHPVSRKIMHVFSRYRIFDPGGHMIRSEHMKSCLVAQIHFMLLKGPLKKLFKSAEMLTN